MNTLILFNVIVEIINEVHSPLLSLAYEQHYWGSMRLSVSVGLKKENYT